MNTAHGGSGKLVITGFINVPLQRHFRGEPDGNTLWLWNPTTESTDPAVQDALHERSGRKAVVRKGNRPFPYLKIRFQGIDTPETHYTGDARMGGAGPRLKQNYGFLARDAMFQLLGNEFEGDESSNGVKLVCSLDGHGRFWDSNYRAIGYVCVNAPSDTLEDSLNYKLVKSGYAFPMLYNSLPKVEIDKITRAAQEAYERDAGVWREYSQTPVDGTPALNDDAEVDDWGNVNFPKYWRRWVTYNYDADGRGVVSFVDWLQACSDDALDKRSVVKRLSKSVSPHDYRLKAMPWELIFKEKEAPALPNLPR